MGENDNRLIFKNYEYFKAVIEEGGVSKAAEKLFISQSSVSKYLKRLEDNIGHKLFSRKSYPLGLSEAGELYLKYINQIFALEREFRANIAEWKEDLRGEINIGIPFFHSAIFFPAILLEFNKKYPDIRIRAYERSPREITTMLDQGKIDLAVVFQTAYNCEDIMFEHILSERILFFVNKSNAVVQDIHFDPNLEINRISSTEFLQFRNEPFVLIKKGHNSRHLVQNYFDKFNFKPNIVLETSNISTAVNLVKAKAAVTFVPEMLLKFEEQAADVLCFHVDDPVLQREMGIAYSAKNTLTKQHRFLIDISKELIPDCLKSGKNTVRQG
ncbi:MAG: LysR family transcriptional regulator [Treponema sp.]|nr:LysR family transcriptional regulator [Treponema sp.]